MYSLTWTMYHLTWTMYHRTWTIHTWSLYYVPSNHVLHVSKILTTLLVLFLICLYISSRDLSKVFEHRNFVAQYQKPVSCESCAPGNYGRQLTILIFT